MFLDLKLELEEVAAEVRGPHGGIYGSKHKGFGNYQTLNSSSGSTRIRGRVLTLSWSWRRWRQRCAKSIMAGLL